MVLVVRQDLKMSKGKTAAQCGHATVGCTLKAMDHTPKMADIWLNFGSAKIALKCRDEQELNEIMQDAESKGVVNYKVADAGYTEVAPGTVTVLAVGPAPVDKINEITGKLSLL